MNRTGDGGPLGHDPLAGVLNDRDKRALAAQLLGQAYVTAHALIAHNQKAVEKIAEALIEKRELFGDELVEILEAAKLQVPELDRIRAETATVAQDTALRREALELALYTFEYAPPIDHVAVLFPPGPKQNRPSSALFFHRDELASQLGRPLHTTLPHSRPPLPGRLDPAEKKTVIRLTAKGLPLPRRRERAERRPVAHALSWGLVQLGQKCAGPALAG